MQYPSGAFPTSSGLTWSQQQQQQQGRNGPMMDYGAQTFGATPQQGNFSTQGMHNAPGQTTQGWTQQQLYQPMSQQQAFTGQQGLQGQQGYHGQPMVYPGIGRESVMQRHGLDQEFGMRLGGQQSYSFQTPDVDNFLSSSLEQPDLLGMPKLE